MEKYASKSAAKLRSVEPLARSASSAPIATQSRSARRAGPDAAERQKCFVLDTNVLIHDPGSVMKFAEHKVIIPMTVLEELDKLKSGRSHIAVDCRAAIRAIDEVLGNASVEAVEQGVPIVRDGRAEGSLSVLIPRELPEDGRLLSEHLNDNVIINDILQLQARYPEDTFVLVSKDINMRLKARACGIHAEDYQNDQLLSDIEDLNRGYYEVSGSFWDGIAQVETFHAAAATHHELNEQELCERLAVEAVYPNQFILDEQGFVGRVERVADGVVHVRHLKHSALMEQSAWGLKPINIYQALALNLLLDPDIHLVTLTGAAGSGKTILALAAAIDMVVEQKRFNKIIATRSTPPLAEDHGFLPGTEQEKMDPWLGAITDNIEALHLHDENPSGSIEYVTEKANIQFKALNYIRGRSFQRSLILIDESQNLTPHQMKAIITRAGEGSKVVCLGNLAQIDAPYLSAISSGLAYMTERFQGFGYGGSIQLNGVPRSLLAEYAESNL